MLPGTGSQHATDTLSKSFPDQANGSSPIVLHVTSGKLTDSRYSSAVNQAAADVAKAPDVASVVNPLTPQGASALSKDQATGYLPVTLFVSPGALSVDDAQTIINAAAKPAQAAGIQVETGGQLGQKVSKPSTESLSELIGIIAAMVILTFTFGTVVSMLMPILTAILGLASTLLIIQMEPHDDCFDGGADIGHHDRPRRRDRLRAVYRDAALPRPERWPGHAESIARAVATSGAPWHLPAGR